jgi:uncharacterized lipoprotein YmbA
MTRLLLIAALALLTACGQPMTRADRYQKCAAQDKLASTYPFGKPVCTKRMPA